MKLASWLTEQVNLNGDSPVLPDLTYTLGERRNHHPHRLTLVARSIPELIEELDAFAIKEDSVKVRTSFTPRPESAPRIAFIMSGQGPQWWGMGRELMQHEPVFREVIEQCDAALRGVATFSLLEELGRSEETSQMHRTEIAQPAIFAMQVGLAELWKSWGVHPSAVLGHSVGEIAAACVAGLFSLEQGARMTALRARFMEGCARGEGTMLAVGLGEEEAQALIDKHDQTISIAAFNGPRSLTLAGPRHSIEAMFAELETQGVFARLVRVDHPFHHAMMQPAADALENALVDLAPQPETIPFFSTVTGDRLTVNAGDAAYWARGIRQPVQFAPAINAMADFGVDIWLELSAHPALAHSIAECLASRGGSKPIVISSVRREREHDSVLEAAMDLHRAGVALDFTAMTPSRRILPLPAYAWDRSRWWNEAPDWRESRLGPGGRGMLDMRLPRATPTWIARLDCRHMAFLKDHKVENHVIFPAAAFVEMVLEAGVQLFEGRPFVVEDFEIRKPLILPEPAAGVQIEISYEPNERTFAIQSRFEQGASWSLHVVGSMRGERTESGFADSSFDTGNPAGYVETQASRNRRVLPLHERSGTAIWRRISSVRELRAGGWQIVRAGGACPKRSRRGPANIRCIPCCSMARCMYSPPVAATVEARGSQLKLPVRFGRILFLRSPGASGTGLRQRDPMHAMNLSKDALLFMTNPANRVCWWMGSAPSASPACAGGAIGGVRDVLYHVDWERTPHEFRPGTLATAAVDPPARRSPRRARRCARYARTRAGLKVRLPLEDDLAAVAAVRGPPRNGGADRR